jgi:sec-independent protein translocase protein TatA
MVVGAIVLLLFGGKGKISDIMGDVAKGVKSFKKGMADDDEKPAASATAEARALENRTANSVDAKDREKVS